MYQFIIDAAADDNTPQWFNELANCVNDNLRL